MSILSTGIMSGAELFSAGRFSEALNAYDSIDRCNGENDSARDVCGGVINSKAVYAACNRAAAKLELEMWRSCLRDCDEIVATATEYRILDGLPLVGRAGHAYHRLGKRSRAREAIEAGINAGRESGDVILFVQLVETLNVMTSGEFPESTYTLSTQRAIIDSARSAAGGGPAGTMKIAGEYSGEFTEKEERYLLGSIIDDDHAPACDSNPEERITPGAVSDPTASDEADDHSLCAAEEHSGEAGEGSGEEGEGDEEGGAETPGVLGEGESATAGAKTKKKKKKKSRSKRNKAGRNVWAGGEDEFGHKLTLRANKDGGGVVVEGLSAVLAASDISPVLLEAARGQLAHATGNPDIDNLIALGYLQVNTGNYRKAVELFRGLLSIRPGLVGAHLGLGSALALLGGMENAVASFSAAIEANPMEPDCWKRRGQTRAAMGHAPGALDDLNKAVELFNGRDADVYHQRGMVYHKLRYFNRAVLDFGEVVKSNVDSKVDWNMIGLCRRHLGEANVSAKAFRRALVIDPNFKDAYTNLGSLLKDWGKGDEALAAFDSALELDTAYVHAYYLRGLCRHSMGDHRGAQADFLRGLHYDAQDEHCRYMAALCMHARCQMDEAARCYDALLSLKPGHQAWYNRECCVYLWSNLRRPWREFSADAELDPEFKEGWCKRHDPMTLKRYTRHRKPTGAAARISLADVRSPPVGPFPGSNGIKDRLAAAALTFAQPASVEAVLRAARSISPGIQLTCPGFLTNVRQHRMFGLATLELAQLARRHWDGLRSGGTGAVVPDTGSSMWSPAASAIIGNVGDSMSVAEHPLGYRDVFDVAVRWRQLSEPNDPVWWIDRLTPEAFREGFGLQTPMVNGQLKVIRYYPYYEMAIKLMKRLMLEQSNLDDEAKSTICKPDAGLAELHAAVGHDHWVVTPCERASLTLGTRNRIMEGTRLTIVASAPEGHEFTIRTPGKPDRWRQYHEELSAVWGKLTATICENAQSDDGEGREGNEQSEDDAVCDYILEIFYYWVNFGPLSRGSAACGYIVLSGLMAACGWRLAEPLPPNVQMDWEAILRPNPDAFLKEARPWLRRSRRREDILQGVPAVQVVLPTALDAIKALNGPY